MVGVIALAPRRGGGRVDEAAAIGMRLQLGRDPPPGVVDRLAVAEHAAGIPLAVLALRPPSRGSSRRRASSIRSLGQASVVQSPWTPRSLGKFGRVHRVLVDVVAAGEHAQVVQLPRACSGVPRLLQRMRSMPARLHLAADADRRRWSQHQTLTAPTSRSTFGIRLAFLGQRLQQAGLPWRARGSAWPWPRSRRRRRST